VTGREWIIGSQWIEYNPRELAHNPHESSITRARYMREANDLTNQLADALGVEKAQ
jgi:hypothetical protein